LTVEGRHLDLPGPGHLLVHGAGSSGRCEWQRWRAGHVGASSPGPVWTIDLPGHGDSDGDVLNPADAARYMDDAINQLGIAPGDVHARGYGAAVAMSWVLGTSRSSGASAWVRQASFHLHEVILRNDAERSRWRSQYALPILPQWDGSHLIRLWHEIRDRELFHPWFERGRANIRPVEPQLDAESLTESVFAALCCRDWVGAHRYWLDWDPLGAFGIRAARATGAAVHLLAEPGDGWAHCLAELAP
jgi:pimeloyl-ACP methyl ester carboxylesterase